MSILYGVMAQLVERLVRNEEASGSNPLSSTKTKTRLRGVFFVLWLTVSQTAELSAVRASNVRKERMNKREKTYRRCDALAKGENSLSSLNLAHRSIILSFFAISIAIISALCYNKKQKKVGCL